MYLITLYSTECMDTSLDTNQDTILDTHEDTHEEWIPFFVSIYSLLVLPFCEDTKMSKP